MLISKQVSEKKEIWICTPILRSFTVNLYQLFLNKYKDKKVLPTGKTIMADIKRACHYRDDFSAELFELAY